MQILNFRTHTVGTNALSVPLHGAHISTWLAYNIKGIIIRKCSLGVDKEIILEPINAGAGLFYTNRPIKGPWEISDWIRQPCLNPLGETGREKQREERDTERGTVSGTNASCNWSTAPVLLGAETCGHSCATSWILITHTYTHLHLALVIHCTTCGCSIDPCAPSMCSAQHGHSWSRMLRMLSCDKTVTATKHDQKYVDIRLHSYVNQKTLLVSFPSVVKTWLQGFAPN